MREFFSMGGHAWHVWGAYGVTLALIVIEVVLLKMRSRK
ncbi:MAG TPA: heme exporter protein CcmD [Burkholderiales bacterium]|jgi:heme exporter protein CcmD